MKYLSLENCELVQNCEIYPTNLIVNNINLIQNIDSTKINNIEKDTLCKALEYVKCWKERHNSKDTFSFILKDTEIKKQDDELGLYEIHSYVEINLVQNTKFDFPCNVGQVVYFITDYPETVVETKVEKLIITEKGLKVKLAVNSTYETSIKTLGKKWFLDKNSAQKYLNKLR